MGEYLQRFIDRYFPERQLYFRSRSDGSVRYYSLSAPVQLGFCIAAFAAAAWIVASSYSLLVEPSRIVEAENNAAQTRAENEELYETILLLQNDVVERSEELQAKQQYLEELIKTRFGDDANLSGKDNADSSSFIDSAEKLSTLATNGQRHDRVSAARQIFASLGFAPMPAAANAPENVQDDLVFISSLRRLDKIDAEIAQTAEVLLGKTATQIESLQTLINETGLQEHDFRGALEANASMPARIDAINPAAARAAGESQAPADPVTALTYRLNELDLLEQMRVGIPVGPPVNHYYISSSFGTRTHPATKRRSWHPALDMAGVWKTPVKAQANGTVVKAGWNGAYGRMVEIDHGNGIRTKYGHLAALNVKKGDRVNLGDVIGLMGNSGRTTGTHLHYEIWFRDKVLNPTNFIRASNYVAQ